MDMTYNFNSNTEPTDAQLETLMREVAADATKRRKAADKVFWKRLEEEVTRAEERARPLLAKFGKK